ncbi:MAG: MgtC/SapB family protein [Gemmatimonadota bacterium]
MSAVPLSCRLAASNYSNFRSGQTLSADFPSRPSFACRRSIATCAFVIIGSRAFAGDPGAQARVIQGLMTGIGFIGGGAILKQDGEVSGVATASGIWCTGAIGAAVALSEYVIAVALATICWVTLWSFTRLTGRAAEDVRATDENGD